MNPDKSAHDGNGVQEAFHPEPLPSGERPTADRGSSNGDILTNEGGSGLPCLYRNISTEAAIADPDDPLKLKAKYRKTACALSWNVQHMSDKYGISNLGFLTLTFPDHVVLPKEAQRRFNVLRNKVLNHRYLAYIRVFERQKSGRIHYHLVVALDRDIRTGVNFQQFEKSNYSTANKTLRSEWLFWRQNASKYGFGRTELLPIRSNTEGIGRYVGKYIGKHFESRLDEDKGVRLVDYSRGARMASVRHTPLNQGTAHWRSKMDLFAHIVGFNAGLDRCATYEELSQIMGKQWAFKNREFILSLPSDFTDSPTQKPLLQAFRNMALTRYTAKNRCERSELDF